MGKQGRRRATWVVVLLCAFAGQLIGPLAGIASARGITLRLPVSYQAEEPQPSESEAEAAPETQSASTPEEEPTAAPTDPRCAQIAPVAGSLTALFTPVAPVAAPTCDDVLQVADGAATANPCAVMLCPAAPDDPATESPPQSEASEDSSDFSDTGASDGSQDSMAADSLDASSCEGVDSADQCVAEFVTCVSAEGAEPAACLAIFQPALDVIVENALACTGLDAMGTCPVDPPDVPELPECEPTAALCLAAAACPLGEQECSGVTDALAAVMTTAEQAATCAQDTECVEEAACSADTSTCTAAEEAAECAQDTECVEDTVETLTCATAAEACAARDEALECAEAAELCAQNHQDQTEAAACAALGNWTQCADDVSALKACAGNPGAQACENAAFTSARNALCGMSANPNCVPAAVTDLRGCVTWTDDVPGATRACGIDALVDTVCGDAAECVVDHPVVDEVLVCAADESADAAEACRENVGAASETFACATAPAACTARDDLQPCSETPDLQVCENAAFVAASNALCGVVGDEDCVPDAVTDLRGCAEWGEDGSPQPSRACVAEIVTDAVCAINSDGCLLEEPVVAALVTCGTEDGECAQALEQCAAAPTAAPCSRDLRALWTAALCDTNGTLCFETLNDDIDKCEGGQGCIAAAVFREACVRRTTCAKELQDLEPCLVNSSTCNNVFFRKWLGRACAKNAPSAEPVCPRNPVVEQAGRAQDVNGTVVQVPFENGSTQFPFRTIKAALDALRTGGTDSSPALASPINLRNGAYTKVEIQTFFADEIETQIFQKAAGGSTNNIVIDGGAEPGIVLRAGRTVAIGDGITVRGTPAISGPAAWTTISGGGVRINAGEPADFTLRDGVNGLAIPEPVERHIRIEGGSADVRVERFTGSTWVTLTPSGGTGIYKFAGLLGVDIAKPPGVPLSAVIQNVPVDSVGTALLRITPATGSTFSVKATMVGLHTGAVYATAQSAWVHAVGGQIYDPQPQPRPDYTLPSPPSSPEPVVAGPEGDRLRGDDRAATAAAVSRSSFSSGAGVVYVATGAAYADALAAGPAAVRAGGPVLLVERDRLPDATKQELQRLRPGRVYVLGGSQAVSEAVASELASMTGTLTRLRGTDRYATAATVSAAHFGPGVPVVYVASGQGFADALSGGAAAAAQRGPVLLVEPDTLPASTSDELRRLGPARIVVLGGTAAVSERVALQLRLYTTGAVQRVSGPTRYATSAAISRATFPRRVATIYIATGESFPDALAGVPAAGSDGAPLLLVQSDKLPDEIAAELDRLRPQRIVILGGERSVSLRLEREIRSYEQ